MVSDLVLSESVSVSVCLPKLPSGVACVEQLYQVKRMQRDRARVVLDLLSISDGFDPSDYFGESLEQVATQRRPFLVSSIGDEGWT